VHIDILQVTYDTKLEGTSVQEISS